MEKTTPLEFQRQYRCSLSLSLNLINKHLLDISNHSTWHYSFHKTLQSVTYFKIYFNAVGYEIDGVLIY